MKKISQMITENRIIDLKSDNKKDILKELVDVIATAPEVTDKDNFYLAVMKRESVLSTGIGIGLAVPHVNIDSVKDFVMAIGRKKSGVDFDSLNGKPVYLIVMVGANTSQHEDYLKILAKICMMFKDMRFREGVLEAATAKAIYSMIKEQS